MGDLKDILIGFPSNPHLHQIIVIVMDDIHEAYGIFF